MSINKEAKTGSPEPDDTEIDLFARFPSIRIDRDNEPHYRGLLKRRYLVNHCQQCGHWHHPPRAICPSCWSREVVAEPIAGRGRLFMLTLLHQGPEADGVSYDPPYPLAVIELAEQPGLRIAAPLAGCDPSAVQLDDPVEIEWLVRAGNPQAAFRVLPAGNRGDSGKPALT